MVPITDSAGVLRQMMSALAHANIPYMVTGPFGAAWHGAGPTTLDFDVVARCTAERLHTFARQFATERRYLSLHSTLETGEIASRFDLMVPESGWKIHLTIRPSRPYSRMAFERRIPFELFGLTLWVATAEDLIIATLERVHAGAPARELGQAARLMVLRGAEFDSGYVDQWAAALGVDQQWTGVRLLAERRGEAAK